MSANLLQLTNITEESPAISSVQPGNIITLTDDALYTVNRDICITVLSGIAWITSGYEDIIRYPHETINIHRSQYPTIISSAKSGTALRFRCGSV